MKFLDKQSLTLTAAATAIALGCSQAEVRVEKDLGDVTSRLVQPDADGQPDRVADSDAASHRNSDADSVSDVDPNAEADRDTDPEPDAVERVLGGRGDRERKRDRDDPGRRRLNRRVRGGRGQRYLEELSRRRSDRANRDAAAARYDLPNQPIERTVPVNPGFGHQCTVHGR